MRPSAWARLPAAGRLKRRPYIDSKSEEADESRLGTAVPCPYNGRMRPSAWARLPAAGRLKRRPYMIWVPFFFKKGNNGCWLLTKCIQRLHF